MGIEIIPHYDLTLLPCPMCGSKPAKDAPEAWAGGISISEKRVPENNKDFFNPCTMFTVTCGRCHLKIARANLDAVRAAWNTRKSQDDI